MGRDGDEKAARNRGRHCSRVTLSSSAFARSDTTDATSAARSIRAVFAVRAHLLHGGGRAGSHALFLFVVVVRDTTLFFGTLTRTLSAMTA